MSAWVAYSESRASAEGVVSPPLPLPPSPGPFSSAINESSASCCSTFELRRSRFEPSPRLVSVSVRFNASCSPPSFFTRRLRLRRRRLVLGDGGAAAGVGMDSRAPAPGAAAVSTTIAGLPASPVPNLDRMACVAIWFLAQRWIRHGDVREWGTAIALGDAPCSGSGRDGALAPPPTTYNELVQRQLFVHVGVVGQECL